MRAGAWIDSYHDVVRFRLRPLLYACGRLGRSMPRDNSPNGFSAKPR